MAQIWCQSLEGILSWQLSCSEATARHAQVVGDYLYLSRVSTPTRDIDIAVLSVCPWRSGIRWKQLNILTYFFHHRVVQSFYQVVLSASNIVTKFRGAKYRWSIKILRFSTNKFTNRLLRQSSTDWCSGKVVIVARRMIPFCGDNGRHTAQVRERRSLGCRHVWVGG